MSLYRSFFTFKPPPPLFANCIACKNSTTPQQQKEKELWSQLNCYYSHWLDLWRIIGSLSQAGRQVFCYLAAKQTSYHNWIIQWGATRFPALGYWVIIILSPPGNQQRRGGRRTGNVKEAESKVSEWICSIPVPFIPGATHSIANCVGCECALMEEEGN